MHSVHVNFCILLISYVSKLNDRQRLKKSLILQRHSLEVLFTFKNKVSLEGVSGVASFITIDDQLQ